MNKLLMQGLYVLVGIGALAMFAYMLKNMWNDYNYYCDVIEDEETGQRTSTIYKK